MQQKFGIKQFAVAFLACVAAYLLLFYGLEHLRNRRGPWEVRFTAEAGSPAIVINQPALGIHDVRMTFPAATTTNSNADATLLFAQARSVPFVVPYGTCVFQDTTSLPGTVVLQLFGHEIQLLPRVLTIDGKEHAWQPDATIPLEGK